MSEEFKLDARREHILKILQMKGKVKVTDLSELFKISDVTIRNDLTDMEREGLLERVHGGAVSASRGYRNLTYLERKSKNMDLKKQIAVTAASMISDGETVMINAGTTTHFIAQELKAHKNLNIVTNSLNIAMELGNMPNHNVILLGGNINAQYSFIYGNDALQQLKRYKADKFILSVDGVNIEHGITTYHFQETALNEMMIERANNTLIVGDSTKIGKVSFSFIAPITSADYLITNVNENSDELDAISKNGVEVIISK